MICIYHSRDLDGWCSAAIIKKYCQQGNIDLKLIGWDYGQPYPEIPNDEKIVIVDVSFDLDIMQLFAEYNDVTWIDHHKSSINKFLKNPIGKMNCVFPMFVGIEIDKKAACELTWNHFYPGIKIPYSVTLLGAYDSYRHKGTKDEDIVAYFQYASRTYINNPESCMKILEPDFSATDYVYKGETIYKYLYYEALKTKSFTIELDGYKFKSYNKSFFNPKNFNIPVDNHDGFICFAYAENFWTITIYSDTIDCSEICKSYGGGGHAGAAGFTTKSLQISNNKLIL